MDSFLATFFSIFFSEFGDKTQLMVLMLASRFQKPLQILLGVSLACILSASLAGWLGISAAFSLQSPWFSRVVGAAFLVLGLISFKKEDTEEESESKKIATNALFASFSLFFLSELGDKTQITTMVMGAKFQSFLPVVCGSALALILVNAPAIFLGDKISKIISISILKRIAGIFFILFGILTLFQTL